MTNKQIIESGMAFGPYPEGHCFYIEKSRIYKAIEQNTKIAEFLLLRYKKESPPTVQILEAKSSSPRPATQPAFDNFIQEIRDKLINAFSLGLAACLNRHKNYLDELPSHFKRLDLSNTNFIFLLVIRMHKEEWLPPVREILMQTLQPTLKTWGLPTNNVAVFNEQMALDYGIVHI